MKILQNKITGTQTSFSTNFGGKLSFILSFLFPERLHCCYIYFFLCSDTCTTIINTLEPCALNAEFQHFILLITKFPYFADTSGRGDRGWKQAQREGEDRMTLWITLVPQLKLRSSRYPQFWVATIDNSNVWKTTTTTTKTQRKIVSIFVWASTWSSYRIIPKKHTKKWSLMTPISMQRVIDDREKPTLDDDVVIVVVAPT